MESATALIILKFVELGLTYGPQAVTAIINTWPAENEITLDDLNALEAQLKHPSEYMPRP
jgi:hypothetical protein